MEAVTEKVINQLTAAYPRAKEDALQRNLTTIIEEARAQELEDARILEQLESWVVQFPHRQSKWLSTDAALADLRRLLIRTETRKGKTWQNLRKVADWIFEHYLAVASLITVIASAFYGLAYARFYDSLDITPEQAGLGPTQILTHSAVGGLTLTMLIALAICCLVVPLVPLRDEVSAKGERGTWIGVVVNAGLTALGIIVIFGLGSIAELPYQAAVSLAWAPTAFFLGASIRLERKGRGVRFVPKPLYFSGDRYLIILVAFAIPTGLLFTGLVTFDEADRLGRKASNGKAVRDPKIIGVPFLGVRVEPALVSWGNTSSVPDIPRCVFYLGTSSGSDVFYDHRSRSTYHVPADEVTIELRSDMSSCEAPVNKRLPTVYPRKNGDLVCRPGRWSAHADPLFTYEWITGGGETVDGGDEDFPWVFSESALWLDFVMHCRVTAATPLGSDAAVSRAVVLGEEEKSPRIAVKTHKRAR